MGKERISERCGGKLGFSGKGGDFLLKRGFWGFWGVKWGYFDGFALIDGGFWVK